MKSSVQLTQFKKLIREKEEGFSLIELVVVVSVLAVLSAIAIPTFVCTTRKARATTALAALKQIQTECTVKKTNREYIASTFTTSNLQGYQIESDGGNSCDGNQGTGLISAIPNEPDQLPTFILATNSNELTYSFKDQTGTNFQDCLSLICLQADSSGGGQTTTKNGVSIDQNGKPIILTGSNGEPEIMTWWYNWSATGGSPSIPCRATVGVVKKPDETVHTGHPNNQGKSSFVMMERSHPDNLPESNMHAPDCPMVVVPDSLFSNGAPTKPFEVKESVYLSGILNRGYGVNSPREIFNEEGKPLMFVPADPALREQIKQRYPSIDWDTMTYGME